ncbi:MAG: leucine-rich repeat protein, partial [Mucinivorans sp.]
KHAIFTSLCQAAKLERADVSAVPVIGNKFPFLGLTFKDFTKLAEIRVKNGVILGGQAFMNCTALTTVNYPAVGGAVVLEGDQAFASCTSLVTIATSTTNIPDNSFNGCALLANIAPAEGTEGTGVTIKPTTVGVGAFKDCKAITDINLDAATVIKADAFKGCTALVGHLETDKNRTVLRVNAIKIIEPGSFAGCTNIRFISFKNAKKLSIGCFTGSGIPGETGVATAGEGFQEIEFLSIFEVVGNTTSTSNLFGGAGVTVNKTKLFIDANQAGKEASIFTIKGDGETAVDCATTFAGIQRNPVL